MQRSIGVNSSDSIIKAESWRFVKHSLLRLFCTEFILNYLFFQDIHHEDVRTSRFFNDGHWRCGSYLHGSCLRINILRFRRVLIDFSGVQCLPIHHLVR